MSRPKDGSKPALWSVHAGIGLHYAFFVKKGGR